MADEKLVTREERIQEQQRVAAREAGQSRAQPADKGPAGGRYLVGGQLVDSEGKPLKNKD